MEIKTTELEKGRDLYHRREYEQAEPILQSAIRWFPNYADIWNMLGVIHHEKGEFDIAQSSFEKALEINPRYTEAALNLAVTYNEQGKYTQARQVHEKACGIRPGTAGLDPFAIGKITNMHADLGQAYAELHLLDRAIEQYRSALDLSPEYVDIRTRFGQLLRDNGYMQEAVIQFKLVLETRNDYIPALISLGATYYALGEAFQAAIQWERAVENDPDNRTAQMYLRMIRQLQALEEAESAGMPLEVDAPVITSSAPSPAEDELQFTMDSEGIAVRTSPDEDEPS
jgi:tetratricopeptide (TPR) repeat protein